MSDNTNLKNDISTPINYYRWNPQGKYSRNNLVEPFNGTTFKSETSNRRLWFPGIREKLTSPTDDSKSEVTPESESINCKPENQSNGQILASDPRLRIFHRIKHRIDSSQIRFSKNNRNGVYTDYIKNVKWDKIKPLRSGVVVYTIRDGGLFFGMGVDTKSGDITDFGGGVKYKRDGNGVNGGLREFTEESLCAFGAYTLDQVLECPVVYSNKMMIIFLPLQLDIEEVTRLFNSRVNKLRYPEISHIVWLSREEFVKSVLGTGYRMYIRVRKLLSGATELFSYL